MDAQDAQAAGGDQDSKDSIMQPPPPVFKPPPPKFPSNVAAGVDAFAQPKGDDVQPSSAPSTSNAAALAAATAAAKAAASAGIAPGQRDRVIAQVTSAMYAKAAAEGAEAAAGTGERGAGGGGGGGGAPPGPAPMFEAPDWSGVPEGVEYTIEVLKNGAIVENRQISSKALYMFGRSPTADFILEHPSASRLHAVLVYNAGTKEAFIYDPGSTHGTFLNKQRIKPKVYVPLAVGHTLRFGSSSRIYVVGGPAELMPPEGLSRQQRHQLAALEASRRQKEKQDEAAKRAMAAALSGGTDWGMGADAEDFDPNDADSIDWRAYVAAGNKLNERQQKLADKIRGKEWKLQNLTTENQRITAKERQEGGLTQGQATTLARNTQAMDKIAEEMEDLEEILRESIRDTLQGKKREKETAEGGAKRRERPDSDGSGSDSDDGFFDRTAAGGKTGVKRHKPGAGGAGGPPGEKAVAAVESAEGLYGKRELLQEEKQRLQKAIEEEAKALAAAAAAGAIAAVAPTTAASAQPTPGKEPGQVSGDEPAATDAAAEAPGAGAAAQEMPAAPAPGAGGDEGGASGGRRGGVGGSGGEAGDNVDSLDAFMANMDTQIEKDKLALLKRQLADVESQLARVGKLLRIADPDGWLAPGTAAAERARAAAVAARDGMGAEDRRVKAAAATAAAAAAKRRKEEEAAKLASQMEVEEEEDEEMVIGGAGASSGPASTGGAAPGRPSVVPKAAGLASGAESTRGSTSTAEPSTSTGTGLLIIRKPPGAAAARQAAVARPGVSAAARAAAAQLMADMNAGPSQPALPTRGRGLATGEGAAGAGQEGQARAGKGPSEPGRGGGRGDAEAAVAADLEVLAAARRRRKELEASEAAEAAQWRPPEGQKGDGRTSLNDRLGY